MTEPADALALTLYGDLPLDAWPTGDDLTDEPWGSFVRARRHLDDGDQDLAVRAWVGVTMGTHLEARHRLQAWHFLRSIGVHPDATIAAEVWGVVAEVAVDDGHDLLAAYDVGGVRYLNHAGGVTIVEDLSADAGVALARWLAAAQQLAGHIGVWTEPSRPALAVGDSRMTMLTPGGLRFGQGPDDVLRADAMAGPLFSAATALLIAVLAPGGDLA